MDGSYLIKTNSILLGIQDLDLVLREINLQITNWEIECFIMEYRKILDKFIYKHIHTEICMVKANLMRN